MRKMKMLLFGVVLAALLALPGAAMAKSRDRDHDKLPDRWEKKFNLSTHHKSATGDPDRDGLDNLAEFRSHTNPRKADTDGDGVRDGADDSDHDGLSNSAESSTGNDPSDRDSDNDGVRDGDENAGTIVGFTEDSANPGTGVLVIKLADNSTVTGNVTSATRIDCENEGGDDSGRLQRNGADDGANHDVNDDHGGDAENGTENGTCTTADLTPGMAVHQAELQGTGDQAVFEEVELLG
jgi:hypothetical protein